MKKRWGFTLIEMLMVLALGFIIVLLVYQTMQRTLKVSYAVREKISDMHRINFFLGTFSSRLMCAIAEGENNVFTSTEISVELDEYHSRKTITYSVEPDENGKYGLIVKEKDMLLGTESIYPALLALDRVEFSYFDGESWQAQWDKKNIPQGIAITFEKNGSKWFFPVMVNIQTIKQT
ncbi:MAG: prepilin-type N-terminal cleavage/methylation domain-containing protein [Candidatus Omnitrophica bacterium]|nr:prepilin-type N-terminal cleavage/methylation domain-containing protein [Candidatus Omnitrophota bacterium]MCM8829159.1 prepilin-type N-terminal cleavage/methylation domain-containing protein [Candidatus Omnitrophota bacterium]